MSKTLARVRMTRSRSVLALSAAVGAILAAGAAGAACSSTSAPVPATVGNDAASGPVDSGTSPGDAADAGAPDVGADAGPGLNEACDPIKQNCADPSLKCTVILDTTNDYVTGCELPSGTGGAVEGAPCTRTAVGHDDCAKGLGCMPSPAGYICKKFCVRDTDCSAQAKCAGVTTTGPAYGACLPVCTPFGTGCPGATCSDAFSDNDGVNVLETCRPIGVGVLGSPCQVGADCAANLNCRGPNGSRRCVAQCDANHACDGGTCTADPGLPNDAGTCN